MEIDSGEVISHAEFKKRQIEEMKRKIYEKIKSINFNKPEKTLKVDISNIFQDINISIDNSINEIKLTKDKELKALNQYTYNINECIKEKNRITNIIDELSDKHKLKEELKAEVKQKFKIGDHIMLRTKSKGGSNRIERIYEVRQIIWCINDLPIQSLVVKQLLGPNTNAMAMNIHDCKRLHVKYEAGLQILSMKLNWIKK